VIRLFTLLRTNESRIFFGVDFGYSNDWQTKYDTPVQADNSDFFRQ